jgi:hypothetical protein
MNSWSGHIGAFEFLLRSVANVENVHLLVSLGDAIDYAIDMGFVAIEEMSEVLVLRCDW